MSINDCQLTVYSSETTANVSHMTINLTHSTCPASWTLFFWWRVLYSVSEVKTSWPYRSTVSVFQKFQCEVELWS